MATQSLSDAFRSGILDVLLESCPTKIFLPNEDADISAHRSLRINTPGRRSNPQPDPVRPKGRTPK
jgi:type IV secretory pathway VirB4 component